MDPFENDLRNALREPEPPASLAEKVVARVGAKRSVQQESRRRWLIPAAAAVFVGTALLSMPFFRALVTPDKVYAIVQTGPVYQVTEGKTQAVGAGEKVRASTPVRTDGSAGAVLKLPDGSKVEMHIRSEVSLEPTADGLRIRLNDGNIVVTPSKQPAGNLYVQNREATVPVTGTVFQSAGGPERLAFEVAAVKRRLLGTAGGRGAGGNNVGPDGCAADDPQIDPRRFAALDTNVWTLITWAYGADIRGWGCSDLTPLNLISGGPEWIKTEKWDVEAVIPEGAITLKDIPRRGDFASDKSPKLQRMILSLLEERFKFTIRRESKEVQAYVLVKPSPGPLKERTYPSWWDNPTKRGEILSKQMWDARPAGTSGLEVGTFVGKEAYVSDLVVSLARFMGRPILDRTGFTEPFTYSIAARPVLPPYNTRPEYQNRSNIFKALEEQVGLKLEETRTTVEMWVIERIERPSEN